MVISEVFFSVEVLKLRTATQYGQLAFEYLLISASQVARATNTF
jgi:hypothetical protein